jgi:serine/threonine protein kinase
MSCIFGNRNCYSRVVTLSKSEYVTFDDIDFDIFGLSDEEIYEDNHYIYHNYEPFSVILARKIVNEAKNELDKLDLKSELDRLNKFHLEYLQIGRLLGSGGQSNVFEIIAINKFTKRDYNDNGFRELGTGHSLDQEQYCYNHRKKPLAIKMLRHKLMETTLKFANAAVDMMLEAAILSSLDHPSIVKLHGISAGAMDGYHGGRHDSFFLILDLLPETLRDRLIRWRKYDKKQRKRIWTLRANNKDVEKNLFMIERLKVATEIASGMAYLHSRRLVYRDLKPCNIGFDIQDQVKIFDFGLCGELSAEGICGVHNMIGGVGTYG